MVPSGFNDVYLSLIDILSAQKSVWDIACNLITDVSDDGINGDAEYDPPPPHKKTKATHQVTELKHKAATGFCAQSASGVNRVGDFLQKKVVFDMERHKAS